MNYIGSKYSLLPEIEAVLDRHNVPPGGPALDLFAGTGAVAQLLKQRGHIIYANDWQHYAYLTNVAFIEHNHLPPFERLLATAGWAGRLRQAPVQPPIMSYSIQERRPLPPGQPCARVLAYLNHLPGQDGPFSRAYCQGGAAGRMYYSHQNGQRIQAIRDQVERWRQAGLVDDRERAWLVACLIEAADRVANTASVYGAYLKHLKKTAQKPLALVALKPAPSPHPAARHQALQQDGATLLSRWPGERLELVYIDPPYNHRQYSANYHILETIARWDLDRFEPRGLTGLRPAAQQRSAYCLRSQAQAAFGQLFEHIRADYLLFSYNNEGLLSREKLLALFDRHCTEVELTEVRHYKRFRADLDRPDRVYKADHTHEYLILGRPGAK